MDEEGKLPGSTQAFIAAALSGVVGALYEFRFFVVWFQMSWEILKATFELG